MITMPRHTARLGIGAWALILAVLASPASRAGDGAATGADAAPRGGRAGTQRETLSDVPERERGMATQRGGWRVTEFPAAIVRPQGGTGPADSHVFVAISIGTGRITLVAAGGTYTVTVQVLRDRTQSGAP